VTLTHNGCQRRIGISQYQHSIWFDRHQTLFNTNKSFCQLLRQTSPTGQLLVRRPQTQLLKKYVM
jgi:hypothetical protein